MQRRQEPALLFLFSGGRRDLNCSVVSRANESVWRLCAHVSFNIHSLARRQEQRHQRSVRQEKELQSRLSRFPLAHFVLLPEQRSPAVRSLTIRNQRAAVCGCMDLPFPPLRSSHNFHPRDAPSSFAVLPEPTLGREGGVCSSRQLPTASAACPARASVSNPHRRASFPLPNRSQPLAFLRDGLNNG